MRLRVCEVCPFHFMIYLFLIRRAGQVPRRVDEVGIYPLQTHTLTDISLPL